MSKSEEPADAGEFPLPFDSPESVLEGLASIFQWTSARQKKHDQTPDADAPPEEPLNLEARYHTLVEQIPAVVFMAYLDQGIGEAYVSPHIEALLGFTREEWLTDPVRWYQQVHPDDKARWSLEAARMFLSGEPLRSVYRIIARDGKVMWFQCEAKMVHRENGAPWFIHGVAIDVTDLKEAEAELKRAHDELETRVLERTAELAQTNRELQIEIAERKRAEEERALLLSREQHARAEAEAANRLKDEFLATISHELRTPLTAVLGWACVLRMGKVEEAAFERALEAIERNARSQSQLIDDLLDVSRIIAGKLRLKVQTVDLVTVIEEALDSVRPAAAAKEIEIHTALKPLARPFTGDPDRLQQIIWNLLSNAVKFTPRRGRVEIMVEAEEDEAVIVVRDDGPGISSEFLPHVFDRFRQADGSFTRTHGGLGLGLAIARHLVELHGGTIQVSNAEKGQCGATFTIRLPILKPLAKPEAGVAVEAPSPPALAQPGKKPLAGLRILVVDDDPDSQELLAMVFKKYGAQVATASSAPEALNVMGRADLDVLVSDIQMPDVDGYELIRKVRAMVTERNSQVTALALTAHAKAEDRARALEAGYQAHVPKPIDPVELVMMVASLAGKVQSREP
jgi:PAS domain S-box-containing protein